MVQILKHWQSAPRACSYLPLERASLEYRLMLGLTPDDLDRLLERGWRRFGPAYFRPACSPCVQCVSLRIDVEAFAPSRTQKRVWKQAQRFRVRAGRPTVDPARLALYRRWHDARSVSRGWEPDVIQAEEYFHQFAFPHPCVRELALYDATAPNPEAERLIAVAVMDETPSALSAIYTFHDPEYARFSLGTAMILLQRSLAAAAQKRWLYLGYRVLGCPSSEYKKSFRPHQLLMGRPDMGETPQWETASLCFDKEPSQVAHLRVG
ncbi:MAG: arginyltransferase [Deltaproteobacteria bacterium]|nr:arginyltransferase [Deltaproteobacteria bacterium]